MDKGGNVLWIIATLVFFMWTLIIERFIYFLGGGWKADRLMTVDVWEGRAERKSWNAKQIRVKLLSESRSYINDNMSLIATCVALCPLLGLKPPAQEEPEGAKSVLPFFRSFVLSFFLSFCLSFFLSFFLPFFVLSFSLSFSSLPLSWSKFLVSFLDQFCSTFRVL